MGAPMSERRAPSRIGGSKPLLRTGPGMWRGVRVQLCGGEFGASRISLRAVGAGCAVERGRPVSGCARGSETWPLVHAESRRLQFRVERGMGRSAGERARQRVGVVAHGVRLAVAARAASEPGQCPGRPTGGAEAERAFVPNWRHLASGAARTDHPVVGMGASRCRTASSPALDPPTPSGVWMRSQAAAGYTVVAAEAAVRGAACCGAVAPQPRESARIRAGPRRTCAGASGGGAGSDSYGAFQRAKHPEEQRGHAV